MLSISSPIFFFFFFFFFFFLSHFLEFSKQNPRITFRWRLRCDPYGKGSGKAPISLETCPPPRGRDRRMSDFISTKQVASATPVGINTGCTLGAS